MAREFRYFRGPTSDMGLLRGFRTCSLCGQNDRCFSLDDVISSELTEEERRGKVGCLDCLRRDRFGFAHDTEVGLITEDGLVAFDEMEDEPRRVFVVTDDSETVAGSTPLISLPQPVVSEDAAAELRRTPNFSTWQDIPWAVHCGDFMAYLEHRESPSIVIFECLHCGEQTERDDPD